MITILFLIVLSWAAIVTLWGWSAYLCIEKQREALAALQKLADFRAEELMRRPYGIGGPGTTPGWNRK